MRKYIIAALLCLGLLPARGHTMSMSAAASGLAYAHHPVATASARAQAAFDRGLTLLYSFERLAARRSFEEAAKADPNCGMAHWGIAMSYGSNINVQIDAAGEKQAYASMQRARALAVKANGLDRAWIAVAATRYSDSANPDFARLTLSYKNAMAALVQRYPDDLDAATLYAESLMDLKPWALYTPAGDPVTGTSEIVAVLESVLRREPSHIGANHYYIHALEASRDPQRALIAANRLAAMHFEPAAAHLVHMPAHIYMRTGDYDAAGMSNEHATTHDRSYLAMAKEDREASAYYDHNLTMLAAGYSMEGNHLGATLAAQRLRDEGAIVPALFVPLRFHRWTEILAMPEPAPAPDTEPMRVAFWHFSRGVALAATGRVAAASGELKAVQLANAALHIPPLAGTYNGSASILGIAEAELAARIAQASGDTAGAIAGLERAVAAQDALNYIEPPDWYFPDREALGAALLGSGQPASALAVFRADLERNPRNPRSLFGLMQALKSSGRGADATLVQQQFTRAWHNADGALTLSSLWQ
jgi:tetratricopeptide (TPR) repeat protein